MTDVWAVSVGGQHKNQRIRGGVWYCGIETASLNLCPLLTCLTFLLKYICGNLMRFTIRCKVRWASG